MRTSTVVIVAVVYVAMLWFLDSNLHADRIVHDHLSALARWAVDGVQLALSFVLLIALTIVVGVPVEYCQDRWRKKKS